MENKPVEEIKIVVAPDSFKGVLTAPEAAAAICVGAEEFERQSGVKTVCIKMPMADGGEGTARVLASACGAEEIEMETFTADMRPMRASYFIEKTTSTAYMDLASASGLPLVPPDCRNPLHTSTYGTGLLMLDAIAKGAKKIIVGAGGSATVDGGIGALQVLGCRFYDEDDNLIDASAGGGMLAKIRCVDTSMLDRRIKGIDIIIAVDVDAPLIGSSGAARVFGPQKGATPEQIEILEAGLGNLKRYFRYSKKDFKVFVEKEPENPDFIGVFSDSGFGAAGGFAGGMVGIAGASLAPGAALVGKTIGLAYNLRRASVIITGEGSADRQTLMNKAPNHAMRIAAKEGVPCMLLAGKVADCQLLLAAGFAYVANINDAFADDEVDPLNPDVASRRLADATLRGLTALFSKSKKPILS